MKFRKKTIISELPHAGNSNEQLLTLPLGEIRGQRCQTIYADNYYSFEGIPYAKPPLGELRFKAPQPVDSWTGVKDCMKCGSKPIQKNSRTGGVQGSEDCLYLNVYTKELKPKQPLPVIIFIYGGSFHTGEATRDVHSPDYFMSEHVTLVTFNYRLCSLGFLSLADPALNIPGNAALKDQVLALKWVKEYISYFGGDPTNITLLGESAGAGCAHALMLSDQTCGLFQRAVLMSGSALNYWMNMPQTDLAYRLAKFHGYGGENIDAEVLDFLQKLEPEKLVKHSLLNEEERRKLYTFSFGPIVEPYVGEDCVLPKRPFEMLQNAWGNRIPLLIGGNSFEGLFAYNRLKMFPQIMLSILNDPQRILPNDAKDAYTSEEFQEKGKEVLRLFFGDKKPGDRSIYTFLEMYSYKIFWHDVHRSILARLAYANAPTYLYRFDFDSPDFNLYRAKYCGNDPVRGVAHADDLSYMFFSIGSWKVSPDSAEYKTIRRLIGILTAFASDSDPNCDETKALAWEPLEASIPDLALNISNDLSIINLPESLILNALDELFKDKEKLF